MEPQTAPGTLVSAAITQALGIAAKVGGMW